MSTVLSGKGDDDDDDDHHDVDDGNSSRNKGAHSVRNQGGSTTDEYSSSAVASTNKRSDQSHAVDSFFASIRVPASFIVATSFSEMFGIYNSNGAAGDDDVDGSKNSTVVQRYLQGLCIGCQFVTFMLSLSVVVFSTSALIRGLTANFDPYAENGYELLFREFHYEFIVTRWSFEMSLFGFLVAVCCKILYEFELFNVTSDDFDRQHLEVGIAIVLIMSSLCLHLFSYINSTLIGWKNSKQANTQTGAFL